MPRLMNLSCHDALALDLQRQEVMQIDGMSVPNRCALSIWLTRGAIMDPASDEGRNLTFIILEVNISVSIC